MVCLKVERMDSCLVALLADWKAAVMVETMAGWKAVQMVDY